MPPRRLSAEEAQLWGRVVESVKPLHLRPQAAAPPVPSTEAPALPAPAPAKAKGRIPPPRKPAPPPPAPRPAPGTTLDGTWDRRLSRGLVAPDFVLDLHGHNLGTAYDLLDHRLEFAIAAEARLLLLVTGKPPGEERPVKRGAIRAAVGDWLAASRHAGSIAAVRNAHPRHGGAGALYIILRRRR
ncbi:MAG TPA: Smr/MutS family protein [Allosphingosinicella sp.]